MRLEGRPGKKRADPGISFLRLTGSSGDTWGGFTKTLGGRKQGRIDHLEKNRITEQRK